MSFQNARTDSAMINEIMRDFTNITELAAIYVDVPVAAPIVTPSAVSKPLKAARRGPIAVTPVSLTSPRQLSDKAICWALLRPVNLW